MVSRRWSSWNRQKFWASNRKQQRFDATGKLSEMRRGEKRKTKRRKKAELCCHSSLRLTSILTWLSSNCFILRSQASSAFRSAKTSCGVAPPLLILVRLSCNWFHFPLVAGIGRPAGRRSHRRGKRHKKQELLFLNSLRTFSFWVTRHNIRNDQLLLTEAKPARFLLFLISEYTTPATHTFLSLVMMPNKFLWRSTLGNCAVYFNHL